MDGGDLDTKWVALLRVTEITKYLTKRCEVSVRNLGAGQRVMR
jgi:hypothetical protein